MLCSQLRHLTYRNCSWVKDPLLRFRLRRCYEFRTIPDHAEDVFFRGLYAHRTNVDEAPEENAGISLRSYGQDSHLRIPPQQKSAQAGPNLRILQGNDENVRTRAFYEFGQVRFVGGFAHDVDVGLVGDRGQHQFSHQTWSICDQHLGLLHWLLPASSICKSEKKKRFNDELSGHAPERIRFDSL